MLKISNAALRPAIAMMPFRSTDHLIVDPTVDGFQSIFKRDAGSPTERRGDQGIVAGAATHPLWGRKVVGSFQLHPGDRLDNIHQLVDRYKTVAAKVKRLSLVAIENQAGAKDTVGDVHKASGLVTVPPDFNLVCT